MKTKEEYYESVLVNRALASDPSVLECPCQAVLCEWHGRCRECVALHRHHGDHVPSCLQPMLRNRLQALADMAELTVTEKERTPDEYRIFVRAQDNIKRDGSTSE